MPLTFAQVQRDRYDSRRSHRAFIERHEPRPHLRDVLGAGRYVANDGQPIRWMRHQAQCFAARPKSAVPMRISVPGRAACALAESLGAVSAHIPYTRPSYAVSQV